jgi:hypothetical protein
MQSNTTEQQHLTAASSAPPVLIVQCMGGWCRQRERCQHYNALKLGQNAPAERLCPKGSDEPEQIKFSIGGLND